MAEVIQFTMDFQCRGYGWSESYYVNSDQPTLKAFVVASGIPMVNKRNAMLGFEATLDAYSASYVLTKGDSYLAYTNFKAGGLGAQIHCSSPHETVYTVMRGTEDRTRRGLFLRGIPDDAIVEGGLLDTGYAAFFTPAGDFMDALKAGGWGWVHATPTVPKYAITDYTQTLDNYVQFTIAGNPFAGVAIGDYRKVRMLFKGLKTVLNGYRVVEVLGAGSAKSLKPEAVFPFTKIGQLTTYTTGLMVMQDYSFQKGGERRAGRPKLHTPGHRSVRPKG